MIGANDRYPMHGKDAPPPPPMPPPPPEGHLPTLLNASRRSPPLQQPPPPQKVFDRPRLEITIPESESDLHTYPAEAVQVRNTFIHVASEPGQESDRLALSCPSSHVGRVHDTFTDEFQEPAGRPVLNLEEALFEARMPVPAAPEPYRAPLAPIGPTATEPEDFAPSNGRPNPVQSWQQGSYAYSGQYSPPHINRGGRRRADRYGDSFPETYGSAFPERHGTRYPEPYPEHYTEHTYAEPYPDQPGQYPMSYTERYTKRYAAPYQEPYQEAYRYTEKYPERYARQYPERPEYPESGDKYNAYQPSSLFTNPRSARPDMPPLPQQMPPPPPSVQTPPPPVPPPPPAPAPKKSRAREAPVVTLGSVPENLLGSPEMPSLGSRDHRLGQCKPCAFLIKGCQNGIMCKFCHLCDAGEKKRRQKAKKAAFKAVMKHG